ncbi:MAG: DUF1214 domain-containing protein [Planctomycetota bacterium]|nr:DUF1214 domain-containing protein [Planctomycetota bacterium]
MNTRLKILALAIALSSCPALAGCGYKSAEDAAKGGKVDSVEGFFSDSGVIVTPETYPTHETSRQLLMGQEKVGVNTLVHRRALTPTNSQPVVRMNRDTYYSMATVDVSKGATITMPELPEGKYMSVQPVTEDHRIQAMRYGSGRFELSTHAGTHLYIIVRLDSTFSPEEAKQIQDQMKLEANSNARFAATPVNKESFTRVEDELKAKMPALAKSDGIYALRGMFTDPRDDSNKFHTEDKYQIGAAMGWGGAQWVDNIYEISPTYPADKCYQVTFEDPKNGAFWSVTAYDKAGFMFNDLASLNSNTATPNADGSFTVSFGCGTDAPNNIATANPTGAFNLAFRHYRPSKKVREEGYRLLPLVKPADTKR